MNLYGSLDIAAHPAETLESLADAPLVLKGVRVLELRMEIDAQSADGLIPPSLHPAIPTFGVLSVMSVADSPFGPFNLADLRVGVRVGGMPSLFVVGAICNSAPAREALAGRWGMPVKAGQVLLEETYHQLSATASVDGRTALEMTLGRRQPLAGTRLAVPSLISLARKGPSGPLILLNTPIEMTYAQVDGGQQAIRAFDGALFNAGDRFRPTFPMSAATGIAEITLAAPDCTIDPTAPAEESLQPLAA